ncbi:MAG: transcription-repair coupling factor [Methylococcales bacterium]|nr:transcription-repair coupling factor [Methylococcales bacterium]
MNTLKRTAPLVRSTLPQGRESLTWPPLSGSAEALALAEAMRQQPGVWLVVTLDQHAALRLQHELDFYLGGNTPILNFPDWETLPYDSFSPLPDIVSERLRTLSLLGQSASAALIVSVATFMQRLAPRAHVLAHSFSLAVGDRFNTELERRKLENVGYQCVPQVYQHGEFAVRGAIVDLFPMGAKQPYRIELFDDDIESIRTFDPDSQRSIAKIDRIDLLPAREFPFTDDSIKRFRQNYRSLFPEADSRSPLYQDVSKGLTPAGIEYYLPLFVDSTETLFDYLPDSATLVVSEGIDSIARQFYQETENRYQQRNLNRDRPVLSPDSLYLTPEAFAEKLSQYRRIQLSQAGGEVPADLPPLPDVTLDYNLKQPAKALTDFIEQQRPRVLLVAESAGYREAMDEQLRKQQLTPEYVDDFAAFVNGDQALALTVAAIDRSLWLPEAGVCVITQSQLYGRLVRQRRRRKSAARELENVVGNLTELTPGEPVVHLEHGVGRYLGLETLTVGGISNEFLMLEYANKDKLYVPVASLNLIGRYTGVSTEQAPLNKLGNEQWSKAKRKALEKARDTAAELLDIQARRAARKGSALSWDEADYLQFATAFPFEETPDQASAIDAVLEDMHCTQPMDRVVCGDVGFGKTEVAMRAAFIAVAAGKQVAVLVPTTLLAQQHFQNFRDRFADWPVRIEVLSRFVSAKQQQQLLADLTEGRVDIVIGTHKLLNKNIVYQDLGLVIIDEEHRFGVRQKEHFKALREQVDLLALTATPIPRTLNMALSGLRDISIIASPPPGRHAIQTFISEWVDGQIQEACQRELKRGGQVFFLHNDIKTLDKTARELERLVPEARIAIGHGQMPERELEQVMLDFYHQRSNLLLCTTIIESGIDIPTANTIIINRADKLGLAQLHQLRGRVGRSHHRAYAYFLVPPKTLQSKDAIKRLEALAASDDLGAGFVLASHDLEIRGAGELLGDEQSGQIQEIGFSLYTELLERAVNALRSGRQPELDTALDAGPELDIQAPALIPDSYLPDPHARLVFYKRIASADTDAALKALKVEMIDRFGLLPEPVKTLFEVARLKMLLAQLGIRKADLHGHGGRVLFTATPAIDPQRLIALLQRQPDRYQFDGVEKLLFKQPLPETGDKLAFLEQLLAELAPENGKTDTE